MGKNYLRLSGTKLAYLDLNTYVETHIYIYRSGMLSIYNFGSGCRYGYMKNIITVSVTVMDIKLFRIIR